MSKKFKIGIVGFMIVVAIGTLVTGTVLAQEPTPNPEPKPLDGFGRKGGFDFRGAPGSQAGLEAAAEVLGMPPEELSLELWGGRTLADLAERAGVALEDIQAAVDAAAEQAKLDAIEQAVQDGNLTRANADWILEGLDNGYVGNMGIGKRGFDGGFGHPRAAGGPLGLEAAATALGMTPAELSTELQGGKSLADLADEKGVALADIQAAVQSAMDQAKRDTIEQAVLDGILTRENADWLLEGFDNGYIGAKGPEGFNGHGGFGGRGPHGGFGGKGHRGGFGNFDAPANSTQPSGFDA
jgi:uncharacterized protein (DUF433 family)